MKSIEARLRSGTHTWCYALRRNNQPGPQHLHKVLFELRVSFTSSVREALAGDSSIQ